MEKLSFLSAIVYGVPIRFLKHLFSLFTTEKLRIYLI